MKIIDIGANIGFYTNLFSRLVGQDGFIYAFEPDPTNFNRLQKTLKHRKNISFNKMAASDKSGSVTLYQSQELNVDHRTYAYDSDESRKSITVNAIALDDFLCNEETFDVIKMDIQGYEHSALKGMENVIGRSKDLVLISELYPSGLKMAGTSAADYIEHLQTLGFNLNLDSVKGDTLKEKIASLKKEENNKCYYTDILGTRKNFRIRW
ncbi:MAG: FkbM family methyltransferase [Oligoflexia bacterium]|nr:FkbM family methyltransferase [Oligoflexia bacterium]